MNKFSEDFRRNHDAISAAVRGGAPSDHIVWASVLLTIFEGIRDLVIKSSDSPVPQVTGSALPPEAYRESLENANSPD